jgi:hypothetical protein
MRRFKRRLGATAACILFVSISGNVPAQTHVAPPQWETNNNATSSMSFGAWVATGSAKLRLSVTDPFSEASNHVDYVRIYTTGSVSIDNCTIRKHRADGSGSNYLCDSITIGGGVTTLAREGNMVIGSGEFLEAEVLMSAGDAIQGAIYHWI